ncbi:hypothetical protein B0H15DRAFT_1003449 [Mycena belliarum]|uniref:Glutaminase A central domain-containing protein n=1 Tax=Mycena belliarum TaxID=1033014 RepID=A0AAD6TUD8_9AGAR|nr:hypothetical protein B0H15DRAFT_1003449 [Mycena belliae]
MSSLLLIRALEISSDGHLNSVDVSFPATPLFLYLFPALGNTLIDPLVRHQALFSIPHSHCDPQGIAARTRAPTDSARDVEAGREMRAAAPAYDAGDVAAGNSQQASRAILAVGMLLVVPPQLTSACPLLPPTSRHMHAASLPPPPRVLVTEGDTQTASIISPFPPRDTKQSTSQNPAFDAVQPVDCLHDIWAAHSNAGGTAHVDVLAWLNKATLDIIGLAGFNYPFNSLSGVDDATELRGVFKTTFQVVLHMNPLRILQECIPAIWGAAQAGRAPT